LAYLSAADVNPDVLAGGKPSRRADPACDALWSHPIVQKGEQRPLQSGEYRLVSEVQGVTLAVEFLVQ
jgi:hypothetical protein